MSDKKLTPFEEWLANSQAGFFWDYMSDRDRMESAFECGMKHQEKLEKDEQQDKRNVLLDIPDFLRR